MYKTLTLVTLIATLNTSLAAEKAKVAEFAITPTVTFDSGYTTRATHLGLQAQKNSAFVASSISLSNPSLTPTLSATYFLKGESKNQVVLDGSLAKEVSLMGMTAVAAGGVQKRIVDETTQDDSLTGYVGLRFVKIPVVTAIATPYISVNRDFDSDLFGATVGLDRTLNLGKLGLTPRVEAHFYDKHTSYTAGGALAYNGFKYAKPYVDVSYVTTDTAVIARKFDGNLALTTGIKLSF